MLKELLKRTLRKTSLNYEEMTTVLCDCEAIMNSRPLIYLAEENTEVAAITPAMFIKDVKESGVPDLDQINSSHFAKRLRYRQRLREELRKRFRIEYLGQLSRRTKCENNYAQVAVGDVVLIGNDLQKRLDWPLAVVKEIFLGKDGSVRVVKLTTAKGELIRPVQRLISLEVRHSDVEINQLLETSKAQEPPQKILDESKPAPKEETSHKTRSGRTVKKPVRLGF
ncbi:PREDICTED: uncharacterized protein LOC108770745 [Trachymyrmex cornetzi]|uniref:uncharacterized protein LOC108770745 n=1 Tax=Trachymyrmex cornetzi TaxID=471704 RepID=UPI00084F3DD9|nr:PREDICTED: uncharacterized protein LOC108770745 [Trachymyrmex cornetzi]